MSRCGAGQICQAILSLLLPVLAHAEQLPIRIYRTADGLARDDVQSVVADKNGYLWFGTTEGLSRFDGYEFTNYGLNEGLPHASVNALLIARDGGLWIGTARGLCRFNPESRPPSGRRFTVYQPSVVKDTQLIFALAEDHEGSIWCGTRAGLFRLRRLSPSRPQFDEVDIGEPKVQALLVDRQGALWIGSNHGLYRRGSDAQIQYFTTHSGLPHDSIHSLFEDRRGRLWVGTARGLCLLAPHPDPRGRAVAAVYPLNRAWVGAGIETADGRLWFASDGLWEAIPGGAPGEIHGFLHYGAANGLSSRDVTALAEDLHGNLWLGSTGGAMKMARNGIRTYGEADGLRRTSFGSLFEDRAGDLFAITGPSNEGFLQRFDGKRFTAIQLRPNGFSDLGWGWNQIGFEDHAGEWWVHSVNGVFRFPHVARFEQLQHTRPKAIYTKRDGLAGNEIFRLFEDSKGDIWISTTGGDGNGLSRWQRSTGSLRTFSREPGFPKSFYLPTAFREDRVGALWIGFFSGGVARYRDNGFQFFGPDEGIQGGEVMDIFTDHTGRLWIGTVRGGLIRVDDPALDHPRASVYTTAQGLSSNEVRCTTEDLFGRLYIGTGRGLDRLNPDGGIEHFTSADGLALGESVVALRDRQGALWFGNTQGLSRWLPEPPQPRSPPPIRIRGVRVRGVPQPISELGESAVPQFSLPTSQNQLQFDFVSIGFRPGERPRYQYMLEGADTAWTPPTELRTVNFASLPPASYRFLVRAVDPSGAPSATPATAAFTILPPYWQRWWFRLLALLVCGSLLYGAHRYNLNRLLELERIRMRIATDLHDDIGASLSQVALLSEVVGQQVDGDARVRAPLEQIGSISRQLVDLMSDIVWSINPKRDTLGDLIQRMRGFASDVFPVRHIAFQFRAPEAGQDLQLDIEARRQVYLIFKESVNNIVRHAEASEAEIDFRIERDSLVLRMSDNGKGFESRSESAGHGLASMQERAERLGGEFVVSSNERGTTVTLRILKGGRPGPWWGRHRGAGRGNGAAG